MDYGRAGSTQAPSVNATRVVKWETLLDRPLDDLRVEYGIDPTELASSMTPWPPTPNVSDN